MVTPDFDPSTIALAERVYADLLRGAVSISPTGVQVTTDPKNIAKISFNLAASFREVERELNAENLPKNQDFKLNISDMTAWSKKPE